MSVDKKININIPQRTIAYLMIVITVILLLILVGIMPMSRSLYNLDREKKLVEFKIEEQRNLLPLYASLKNRLESKGKDTVLPFPATEPLPKQQINRVSGVFKGAAAKANMKILSVSPDLSSLAMDAQSVVVNTVVRGKFLDIRRFLIGLGSIAFVENIDDIHIKSVPNALEVNVKVRVALK